MSDVAKLRAIAGRRRPRPGWRLV